MIDFLSAYLVYSFISNVIGVGIFILIGWMIMYPTIYLMAIKNYNDERVVEKLQEKKKIYISGFIFIVIAMVFTPSEKDFVALYGITHYEQINDIMIKYLEKK